MKFIYCFIPLLLISFSSTAGQALPTLSDFANSDNTKAVWHKLDIISTLPSWVKSGGTDGVSYNVTIDGEKYIVLSGCKPHDCMAESIAVLYSSARKEAHALFSLHDEKTGRDNLTWINVPEGEMIDARTVLFAKIMGSFDNHPTQFNFK